MGIRALRLVAGIAAVAATFAITAGPAGPAEASTGQVVIAVATGTKLEIARQQRRPWQIENVASGSTGSRRWHWRATASRAGATTPTWR